MCVRLLLCLVLFAQPGLVQAEVAEGWQTYLDGRHAAALRVLRPAAESGDPAAQFALGSLYCDGLAVARDYRLARSWFEKAARQGHGEAQFVLGFLLYHGAGQPSSEGALGRDRAAAAPWLEAAAARGRHVAQLLLARLYHAGKGVRCDDDLATELALRAAAGGLAEAQFEAGILLGERPADRAAWADAFMWLTLAARSGHPAAADNLDILARRLEPAEVAEAAERAWAWKPSR